MIDGVELHHGDCLEVMRGMEAGSVDLVLTDPPYGIGITRNTKSIGVAPETGRKATKKDWDDTIPGKEYFGEIFRISKNQIVFGANYFWENFYFLRG